MATRVRENLRKAGGETKLIKKEIDRILPISHAFCRLIEKEIPEIEKRAAKKPGRYQCVHLKTYSGLVILIFQEIVLYINIWEASEGETDWISRALMSFAFKLQDASEPPNEIFSYVMIVSQRGVVALSFFIFMLHIYVVFCGFGRNHERMSDLWICFTLNKNCRDSTDELNGFFLMFCFPERFLLLLLSHVYVFMYASWVD